MAAAPDVRSPKNQGPLEIGAVVEQRYKIVRQLGAGAMGAVYEAEHTGTGRRVALKVIIGQFAKDEGLVARFHREARAAGAIETQYITQVLDTGVDRESELPFMVMEFLNGEDVQHLLKRTGPIHWDLALRIVAQSCLGLQKAHEAHVVHRDIKPANLFLCKREAGEVLIKLLDFGIAKVKMDHANETESAGLTKTGNMLGSPLYMSPEQARGSRGIDHRTDIWSLGIVLYQALTGRTPFQHLNALGELIIAICSEHAPHVQTLAPWIPAEVAAIVHKCLLHDPNQRFQSAQEMFQAIRPLLANGWTISDDMLVPLSSTAREQAAAPLAMSLAPPPPMATFAQPVKAPAGFAQTEAANSQSGATTGAGARTGDPSATSAALSASQTGAKTSGSKTGLVAGLATLAVIGAAAGAYFLLRTPPGPPAGTEGTGTATATETAVVPPPPTASATTTASVAPTITPEPVIRRYVLVVSPKDAKVEVEGEVVPSKNGKVEINGAVGSRRKIKLTKGKQVYETEVALTDSGLLPPDVELLPPGAKPSSSASGGPAPGPGPASPPPIAPIATTFDP